MEIVKIIGTVPVVVVLGCISLVVAVYETITDPKIERG